MRVVLVRVDGTAKWCNSVAAAAMWRGGWLLTGRTAFRRNPGATEFRHWLQNSMVNEQEGRRRGTSMGHGGGALGDAAHRNHGRWRARWGCVQLLTKRFLICEYMTAAYIRTVRTCASTFNRFAPGTIENRTVPRHIKSVPCESESIMLYIKSHTLHCQIQKSKDPFESPLFIFPTHPSVPYPASGKDKRCSVYTVPAEIQRSKTYGREMIPTSNLLTDPGSSSHGRNQFGMIWKKVVERTIHTCQYCSTKFGP